EGENIMGMEAILSLAIGLAFGVGVAYFAARLVYQSKIEKAVQEEMTASESERAVLADQLFQLEDRLRKTDKDKDSLSETLELNRKELSERDRKLAELETTLDQERKSTEEKLAILEQGTQKMKETFENLAAEALKKSNSSFLELAKAQLENYQKEAKSDLDQRKEAVAGLLAPVKETFEKFDKKIEEMEKGRNHDYGSITEQLKSLTLTQENLRTETSKLVNALRRPQARGQWGEIQLRNVVELAGMSEYCDFQEQVSTQNEEGGVLRPDLIVNLPGGKKIVVDSKVSLDAYLNAIETDSSEQRDIYLTQHAQQVRSHIRQLSMKEYWKQFDFTPDFVVLFLPGEVYFSAALHAEASLIEEGARNRVILASPTTLIALLKAVAYGWQQEKVAANSREIAKLGKELHDRVAGLAEHFEDLGHNLRKATQSYNRSLSTLEKRVLVSTRRFRDLSIDTDVEIQDVEQIDLLPDLVQADVDRGA
ncbi:MAG: DNA recombination protein RmuC, partial [Candidatus Omnitrophica bacterium]|nr:DNA recombination protein RmuC [Candidatus Omnitrophota bacterium]